MIKGNLVTKSSYEKDGLTHYIYDVVLFNTVIKVFTDVDLAVGTVCEFDIVSLGRDTRIAIHID